MCNFQWVWSEKNFFTSIRSSCILFVSRIAPEWCKSAAYDLHSKVIETQLERGKKLCRSETSLHLFKCLLNIIEGVRFVSDVNAHASPKKLFLYQMWFPLSNCDDKGETLGKWWLLGDRVRDLDWRAFALSTNSKITKRIKVFLFFHKHSKWKVIIYMMMKMNSKKKKINWKTSEYCDL